MKTFLPSILFVCGTLFSVSCNRDHSPGEKILLKENWAIQSSAEIDKGGADISLTGYEADGWYPTGVPSTVLAALVENGVYPDPYFGTNIDSLPGAISGRRRSMPEDSPFRVPWWYRTEFKLPSGYRDKNIWLHLHSINYRANIWLNGHLIADTTVIEGAYRLYDLNLASYALPGRSNCLALEIYPPEGMDLTITWVDWNPTPPDRGMGIWYDVSVSATGPVVIEDPHVITDLNLPSLDTAYLTVSANLKNESEDPVHGTLKGVIGKVEFSREVTLEPGSPTAVTFVPEEFPQLRFRNPKVWWPHTVGSQPLYDLTLTFETGHRVSDLKRERFGIRKITSHINEFDGKRTRVFQVNGRNIVIRGGGYVEDMMLRPDKQRTENDIRYARHMNLNALRMEAPRGPDYLFDLCDEQGILVMVGWCCCSSWERWRYWTDHTADVAEASWKDQIIRLRNHPSVFDWLYGSDNPPPGPIEQRYINVLDRYDGTRPYQSSATQDSSDIAGYTGVWMGPFPQVYAYRPPSYWYGKLEFNTEAGPSGEQLTPIESMRRMMPEEDLWPISRSWELRLHPRFYPAARNALYARYGEPSGLEEYIMKSQVLQNEAVKAMFEAYAGNKYRSGGIIYWMYNSAWPSLYWQLYDYFFTPNGAFYGTKKACEPLHIQYSYADSAVYVVNSLYEQFDHLDARATLYDFDMNAVSSGEKTFGIGPDESRQVMGMDRPEELSNPYFLKLELKDASGQQLSSNFYWLSTKGDPEADFTRLNDLPGARLEVSPSPLKKVGEQLQLSVTMENTSPALAFSINPKIIKDESGELVVPVFWEDNYFALLPGEKRIISVTFDSESLEGSKPVLRVEGWNIDPLELQIN